MPTVDHAAAFNGISVKDDPAFRTLRPQRVPRVQEVMFTRAVVAALALHRQGIPITPASLNSENSDITKPQYEALLMNDKYLAALADRGIEPGTVRGMTPRQMSALAIYFDSTSTQSHRQRLAAAGVTSAEWGGWLKNPYFAREYMAMSEDLAAAGGPLALQRLVEQVDRGERWAVELMLEVTGRHDRRPKSVDLNALMMGLFTILDDAGIPADVMAKIGTKIKEMVGGGAPQPTQVITIAQPAIGQEQAS